MFTPLLYQIEGCEMHHNCDYYGNMNDPIDRSGRECGLQSSNAWTILMFI